MQAPQIQYQNILRTIEPLMEMSHWENWITEEQYVLYRHSI